MIALSLPEGSYFAVNSSILSKTEIMLIFLRQVLNHIFASEKELSKFRKHNVFIECIFVGNNEANSIYCCNGCLYFGTCRLVPSCADTAQFRSFDEKTTHTRNSPKVTRFIIT